jgi:RNA polymerase sigma factor (sigma-70 family)
LQNKITYTEQELVLLLKQRSREAFSYLYDNYSAALNTIIINVVNDAETAADVLQEVFVKIWKQIELYDTGKGRLFTWMLNIARNAAIDMVRSKSFNNNKQNRELTETVYGSAGNTSISTDTIGLKTKVYQLKEDYRILVELSYFQGFTQDEISKQLNIPLGTVKTRLRAALIQLKQLMQ